MPGGPKLKWVYDLYKASYPDLAAGVYYGDHQASAEELVTPYVLPQENGARAGVRNALIGTSGGSLRLTVLPGHSEEVAVTVSPWSRKTMAATAHHHELVADGRTHVSVDLFQAGLGTAACGEGVLPRYRLAARPGRVRLLLEAV